MDSVYIRGVQNIDFGQAFLNEDDCILFFIKNNLVNEKNMIIY